MKQLILIALLLFNSAVWAADEDDDKDAKEDANEVADILSSVGYPELQVVPRASERLYMEAKAERGSWFVMHWPIELSGLVTAYVGNASKGAAKANMGDKEAADAKTVNTLTTTVGVGWVIGGLVLGFQRPYETGARTVAKIKGKDERNALLKERLAEEALEKPARTMRVLEWVSVMTNATMSAINIPYTNDKGKVTAGLGVVLSFLPFMFQDHTIDVYDKHVEYKKKIYAPLKTGSFSYDPYSKTLTPMTNLVWYF